MEITEISLSVSSLWKTESAAPSITKSCPKLLCNLNVNYLNRRKSSAQGMLSQFRRAYVDWQQKWTPIARNVILAALGEEGGTFMLRTVPTKYGGFCAKFGPCGKSRSLQKLLESTKKNGVATHFFEIISLESQQKCWHHQHFSEKIRKQYFFTDFLRIRLHIQKRKHSYKDYKTTLQMVT